MLEEKWKNSVATLNIKNLTDTLGYDEPETKCKFPK